MDAKSYALSKNYTDLVAIGLSSATVDDVNKSITFTLASDGSQHTIHFDQPKDGISVTGVSDKGNGVFTLLLSDGSESDPIQTIKGVQGETGADGKSAYESAVENGFTGTEQEWISKTFIDNIVTADSDHAVSSKAVKTYVDTSIKTEVKSEVSEQIKTEIGDTVQDAIEENMAENISTVSNDDIDSLFA